MEQFPKVKIELISEERMPDMQQEQVDIVFGINWPAPDYVVAKQIGKTRYILCASPQYLNKYGTPETIKDLEKHRYIPHLGRTPENVVANLKNDIALTLSPQLLLNNAHSMKKCALLGLGVVQLHDYMIEDELKSGILVEVLNEYLKPDIPIYMYYQKHRFVQAKIRQFVNLVH